LEILGRISCRKSDFKGKSQENFVYVELKSLLDIQVERLRRLDLDTEVQGRSVG
jgi:hypothetical protein